MGNIRQELLQKPQHSLLSNRFTLSSVSAAASFLLFCLCGSYQVSFVTSMAINKYAVRPVSALDYMSRTSSEPTLSAPYNNIMSSADNTMISSHCECGSVHLTFPASAVKTAPGEEDSGITAAADCHCPSCRKYHVSAFTSYLQVLQDQVTITGDTIGSYPDSCTGAFGVCGSSGTRMNRIYCTICDSKLCSQPMQQQQPSNNYDNNNNVWLVNMGALQDDTVPGDLAEKWKQQTPNLNPLAASSLSMDERIEAAKRGRMQWKVVDTAAWTWALPHFENRKRRLRTKLTAAGVGGHDNNYNDYNEPLELPPLVLHGGCTCGACQYRIDWKAPSELQHCYCGLCRRLSGGPFMTWIPIQVEEFQWTAVPPAPSLPTVASPTNGLNAEHLLKRYTGHGQRHVCPTCHSVMTITYDTDGDYVIWPAAATLDTIHLPSKYKEVESYLNRVIHICCAFRQNWYELPDDGMSRIDGAC